MSTPFQTELEQLINRHSRENNSNTPDFILAEFMLATLQAFDKATKTRDAWYGDPKTPGAFKGLPVVTIPRPAMTSEQLAAHLSTQLLNKAATTQEIRLAVLVVQYAARYATTGEMRDMELLFEAVGVLFETCSL